MRDRVPINYRNHQNAMANTDRNSSEHPSSSLVSPLVGGFSARYFLEVLFRRKTYILIPLVLTPLMSLLLSYLMAPKYLSTTTILLGKEEILNPLVRYETAVTMNDMNRLSAFRKIILSRPLIEEAIDTVGMRDEVKSDYELEEMVKDVRANIKIMGLQADSFQIGYTAPNPILAKRMVETVSRLFIEKSLKGSRREAEAAVTFIKKAVDHYHGELSRTENELQEFQQKNAETLQRNMFLARQLEDYESKLLATKLQLQAEQLRGRLTTAQLAGENKMVVQKAVYVTNTRYLTQYQELSLRKASLLATRTEAHPSVRKIQREMDNIKQLLAEEAKRGTATETEEIRSPTYHAISAQLEETRIRVGVLEQKAKDFTDLRDEAQKRIREIPKLERVQSRMEGEVTLTREIYDDLRMKLEQAQVSRDIEVEQQASRYTIIDPPLAPLRRHRPIRSVFVLLGLVTGAGLGFVFALLIELVVPYFTQKDEPARDFGMPLIGALPRLYTERNLLSRSPFGVFAVPRCELPPSFSRDLILDNEQIWSATFTTDPNNEGLEEFVNRVRLIGLGINCPEIFQDGRIFMVTSATKSDGKSVLAANLAILQACDLGKPVLLLDTNSKHPSLSERFSYDVVGLGEVLNGTASLDKALHKTEIPNLTLLPCGNMPSHPATQLNAEIFARILAELRDRFELVLVDTPNLLDNAETCLVASQVDGIVFVSRLYHTRKNATKESLLRLPKNKPIGFVMNCYEQWIPSWLDRRV